ncbi:PD-(D/E)XK nuclease superfamily [uncultured Caudovirales phage]|uniref:PD-(D/E)XK nuclease superfamily n=1 Tax=uncultured Caudovirales phage TaxID=2100421 RepID=A0A6J5RW00_9CAUD|nr:PD-(D/E)XK nuclease superfamily [uncultured Caudovirales phage]
MKPRLLSYSEIETAMTCWARWDFAYGGRLAGDTLKSKSIAPILSDGRAWGAGVAAWHAATDSLLAPIQAHHALSDSLDADEAEMHDHGIPVDQVQRLESENRLGEMLDHYMATASPLPNLTRLEGEVIVAIPSRSGKHASTRYRFQCFLDGFTDADGEQWIVEFKLRRQLQQAALVQKSRQPRWYAWALTTSQNGHAPTGVLIDERLNDVPKPARILKSGKPSHAKDQLCTSEDYVAVCLAADEQPKIEIVEHLRTRQWQQRIPLLFRSGEIDEAGQDLVSAAKLIRDLDSGVLTPVRNASQFHCGGCRYREVCAEPSDKLFVDSLFERTVPKRLRELEVK